MGSSEIAVRPVEVRRAVALEVERDGRLLAAFEAACASRAPAVPARSALGASTGGLR